jgi:hypothetical protein
MKSYLKWLTAALVLVVVTNATAGLFESDESRRAHSLANELLRKLEAKAGEACYEKEKALERRFQPHQPAGKTNIGEACWWVWRYSARLSESDRKRLLGPLLEMLLDTARFEDGTHFHAIALLERLRQPEVVPTLLECLQHTGRPLTRFRAGAALVRLGRARAGLPAVEEWARRGLRVDTLVPDGSPTMVFLYPPLKLPDRAEDSALNQYFVRVLSYPSQSNRIDAIRFLLQKDGTNKDAAFAAAQSTLENPRPDKGERFIRRDRGTVLGCLEKHGGARGKTLAAAYGRR